MCELFAWLWLGGGASGTSCTTTNGEDIGLTARWRKKMETREDPVYGDGFRAAKAGYDRCGRDLARFLEPRQTRRKVAVTTTRRERSST